MKKIMVLLIVLIFLFSCFPIIALSKDDQNSKIIRDNIFLSEPIFDKRDDYISVSIDGVESLLLEPGKPQLPLITKTYTFPVGTKILDIKIDIINEKYELSQKIISSPNAVNLNDNKIITNNINFNEDIYESSELYPSQSYYIKKGVGLINHEHVLILNIKVIPQYSPLNNQLFLPNEINIEIEYFFPNESLFNSDEYDMLIIANQEHIPYFQGFIDHKNNLGIRTVIESVEQIYNNYDGVDDAEDIKLRIKDAIEEYGIKYVLLAGGRIGQTLKWYIPDRTINNWESGIECSSDHYYADIYTIIDDEIVFDDWDSNDNGLFAESSNEVPQNEWDNIDYYPDIVIGRIPFRYEYQIAPLLEKIIHYETSNDKQWFKNALVVSGDQYPPFMGGGYGIYEGEMETNVTANLLEKNGFNVVRLWQSRNPWNGRSDVIDAINVGVGFVHFACHGAPSYIGTYPPDDEDGGLVDVLKLRDIKELENSDCLPVVMVHGCHTAQFSVTLSNIIKDINEFGLWDTIRLSSFLSSRWVPYDLTSAFIIEKDDGAIASLGYSGYGYFWGNSACLNGLCPWICIRFFDSYINQSIDILGEARNQAIVDYLNIIGGVDIDALHRNTIEGWILMGDPSLRIGGYNNQIKKMAKK